MVGLRETEQGGEVGLGEQLRGLIRVAVHDLEAQVRPGLRRAPAVDPLQLTHRVVRDRLRLRHLGARGEAGVEVHDVDDVEPGAVRDRLPDLVGAAARESDGRHRDRQRDLEARIVRLEDLDRAEADRGVRVQRGVLVVEVDPGQLVLVDDLPVRVGQGDLVVVILLLVRIIHTGQQRLGAARFTHCQMRVGETGGNGDFVGTCCLSTAIKLLC